MQIIPQINPNEAVGATHELFHAIQQQMGSVPNILRTMGQSTATLQAYLSFSKALSGGELPIQLREQIALTAAGVNGCDYCASAHSALGQVAGLDRNEVIRNLSGRASDPQADVVVMFVHKVIRDRARVSAADVTALRAAGLSDGQIVEIIGHIAMNIFTNYFNHIAGTEIDFPVVRTAGAEAV